MKRRHFIASAWVLVAILALGLAFLTGRATLTPPPAPQEVSPPATYTVVEATVERSSTHQVELKWQHDPVGYAGASGTVTAVGVDTGEVVDAGDELYRVDDRPVVFARGAVPAYRDISMGDRGEDVAQVQEFLRATGGLPGPADGVFGAGTHHAVKRWQKSTGQEQTGIIKAGDLIFSPVTPARVMLTGAIKVGKRINEADLTVEVIDPSPQFVLTLDNAAVPAAGTPVEVRFGESSWPGIFGGPVRPKGDDVSSARSFLLEGDDGRPLCGQSCAKLPVDGAPGEISAVIEQVPRTMGPAVPVSALEQDSSGSYQVRTVSGEPIAVEVVVTDGSRAIVSGVDPGEVIRVFPNEDPASVEGDDDE